jgi:hypothetical protein
MVNLTKLQPIPSHYKHQYSKTPSNNVLGDDHKMKNKNLLASIQTTIDNEDSFMVNGKKKDSNQFTTKNDMATSPIKMMELSLAKSLDNETKPFSDQSSINSSIVSSFNLSNSSRQSLVRVSPPTSFLKSDEINRLEYSRMSQFSDSKIQTSIEKDKKQQVSSDNVSRVEQSNEATFNTQNSEYLDFDTKYLIPSSDKIQDLIRKSIETSKKLSNENIWNLISSACKNTDSNETNLSSTSDSK